MLELGAGIGRFTGELAQKAGEVIALDFIESAIKKVASCCYVKSFCFSMASHSFFGDVVLCRMKVLMGITRTSQDLKIEDGSIDLIFSNWLLMYLSDKEVETVFQFL